MKRRPDGKRLTGGIRIVLFIAVAAAVAIGMNFVLLAHAANPGEPVGIVNHRLAGHDREPPQAAAPRGGAETGTTTTATKSPQRQHGHGSAISHHPADRNGVTITTIPDSEPRASAATEEPPPRADDRAATTEAQSSPSPADAVEPTRQAREAAKARQRRIHELDRQQQELQKQKKELEKELEKANREHNRAREKALRERRKTLEKELRARKQALDQAERERAKAERDRQRAEKLAGADDDD